MYEPAEDSDLLAQVVTTHAYGRVLDIGTGSGILAQSAHDKGLAVTAIDIDSAVVHALQHKPFPVILSNAFENVTGVFDTIVCNPPYLPADDAGEDKRLYGGKKGYEYINELIREAKFHLSPNGQFLFLISTLTKPSMVERTLRQEGYAWTIIAREKLFMEELLVYKAQLLLNEPAELIGYGTRSFVYKYSRGAVKVSSPDHVLKEAQLLQKVNSVGIGPQYIDSYDNKLVMECVTGERFDQYVERTKDVVVMKELLRQARALDTLGMKKKELNHPGKNILVTADKRVVLLDFERSIYTEKPNNVTALATWLSHLLHVDAQKQLVAYKNSYSADAYEQLLAALFT